jgi:hypothetical protein
MPVMATPKIIGNRRYQGHKGYRRIFSRFEKLDLMFLGFISFVLVADGLRMC